MGHFVIPLLTKLRQLKPLIGTTHVTDWENRFLGDVVPKALSMAEAGQVMRLTDNQLDVIDKVYYQHFPSK